MSDVHNGEQEFIHIRRVKLMKRKILVALLLIFSFLMITPSQASAQTPPFPQIGQNWSYAISSEADWDTPIDATIQFSASAKYTVMDIQPDTFLVQQEVSGTVTWPGSAGEGDIVFVNLENGLSYDETLAPSNTSFSFSTTGLINLNDSQTTGLGLDKYSIAILNWTVGSDTILAYVGFTWGLWIFVYIPLPFPPLFLTENCFTMIYWNTSYAPHGNILTGRPASINPSAWTEETLTTPYGSRAALKNETITTIASTPDYANTNMTIWIDKDTGILLKTTDTVDIFATGSLDMTSTTTIELSNTDFLGIFGYLMYLKLFGISLLYILIGVIVLIIIIIIIVIALRRRR
jgi:hypothetical protein